MELYHRTWYDAKINPPIESDRYWCNVREITDLGISYYQWNCSYTERHGFTDNGRLVDVTHWTFLLPRPNL